MTGGAEIAGPGLRCRTCRPGARDVGAGDDGAADDGGGDDGTTDISAADDGAADVGAGDIGARAIGGWTGAVGDTIDAPDGAGRLHIMALVPACGEIVTGGPGLKVESPAGLGAADPLVSGIGTVLPVGAGVGAVLPVGAGVRAAVWVGAVVGVGVAGGDDCGVPAWLGEVLAWLREVLAAGISGLAVHEALGDGWAGLPGALPAGVVVP